MGSFHPPRTAHLAQADGLPERRKAVRTGRRVQGAEILSSVVDGDAVWMEWRMRGTRSNGTPFEFAGVNIFGVREDRFASGRIYTELVRDAGGVDGQLQRMTKGDE